MYPIPPFLSTTKLRFNGRLDPGKFFPVGRRGVISSFK
jgi:hypothetical protein